VGHNNSPDGTEMRHGLAVLNWSELKFGLDAVLYEKAGYESKSKVCALYLAFTSASTARVWGPGNVTGAACALS
jgi:hypothetical protein